MISLSYMPLFDEVFDLLADIEYWHRRWYPLEPIGMVGLHSKVRRHHTISGWLTIGSISFEDKSRCIGYYDIWTGFNFERADCLRALLLDVCLKLNLPYIWCDNGNKRNY